MVGSVSPAQRRPLLSGSSSQRWERQLDHAALSLPPPVVLSPGPLCELPLPSTYNYRCFNSHNLNGKFTLQTKDLFYLNRPENIIVFLQYLVLYYKSHSYSITGEPFTKHVLLSKISELFLFSAKNKDPASNHFCVPTISTNLRHTITAPVWGNALNVPEWRPRRRRIQWGLVFCAVFDSVPKQVQRQDSEYPSLPPPDPAWPAAGPDWNDLHWERQKRSHSALNSEKHTSWLSCCCDSRSCLKNPHKRDIQ